MASPAANTIPFPKPATTTAASNANPHDPGSAASSGTTVTSSFSPKPWQREVLQLLARGASIVQAAAAVGRTESAFFKACTRHPEFAALANEAREFHRASIAEAFHDTESFARAVVDSALRDENLPANIRLRAALAILNRKNPHWLPSALPDFEISPALAETLNDAEAQPHPVSMDSRPGLDKLDNDAPNHERRSAANSANTQDAPQSASTYPAPEDPATKDAAPDSEPSFSPFIRELLDKMDFHQPLELEQDPEIRKMLDELDKLDNPEPHPGAEDQVSGSRLNATGATRCR
jgi:hypothetical protein